MPRFAGHIAADKIAVGGHSFGGYSVFGFCGAIPERYDARIKAAVLYSPSSVGLLYDSSERRAHRVPTMYFIGGDERDNFPGARTMSLRTILKSRVRPARSQPSDRRRACHNTTR